MEYNVEGRTATADVMETRNLETRTVMTNEEMISNTFQKLDFLSEQKIFDLRNGVGFILDWIKVKEYKQHKRIHGFMADILFPSIFLSSVFILRL